MGNESAPALHFRGAAIAAAVLADVAGPELADLVLAGTSAGGLGALFTAARLSLPRGAAVRVMVDSSVFLNLDGLLDGQVRPRLAATPANRGSCCGRRCRGCSASLRTGSAAAVLGDPPLAASTSAATSAP
jgi:hypothetical protein